MRNVNVNLLAASGLASAAAALASDDRIGALRADAENPVQLIAGLQTAFEAFKAAMDEKVKAKADDVVLEDKLGKINATLSTYQKAIDDLSQMQANAAQNADKPVVGNIRSNPEHIQAFDVMMRRGDRGGSEDIQAAIANLDKIQAAMTVGTPSEGGYLAPVEWDRTITSKLEQDSPMRTYAQVISITGAGFERVYNDGVIGSGWVGETAARPATTTPGLSKLPFGLGELYANPGISQTALDDAAIDLEAFITDEVRGEFGRQENIAFLSGNGTNKPRGVLTYVTGAAAANVHPFGAIEALETAGVGAMTADDIIKLVYSLPTERVTSNSRFFLNRMTTLAARLLKNSDGDLIWQPSFQLGQPATLAGQPMVELPGMPVIANGNVAALFGDMSRTYLIVDRIGIRVTRDPLTNKPFIHFYTTKRVGGGVQNPEFMKALKIKAA